MSDPASTGSVSSTARSAPSASAFCSGRWAVSGPMQTATISSTCWPDSRMRIASSSPWTSNGFSSLSPERSSRWVEGSSRRAAVALGTSLTQTAMFNASPPRWFAGSLADERGLALLDERPQALLGVVRREHERVQVGLVDEVAADVSVQRPVGRLLRVVERDRALLRHQVGELHRLRHQVAGRVHVLHQSPL